MRSQKGITLIALVITIIVLLILAGVSIAMLTGQNGVLTRATDAKEDTAVAEAVERINMELNAAYALILSGDITGTTFSEQDIAEVQANLPEGYVAGTKDTNTLTVIGYTLKHIIVDISSYVAVFSKKPRGFGHWVFRIAGELTAYEFTDYATARRKAAKQAESRRVNVIELMA